MHKQETITKNLFIIIFFIKLIKYKTNKNHQSRKWKLLPGTKIDSELTNNPLFYFDVLQKENLQLGQNRFRFHVALEGFFEMPFSVIDIYTGQISYAKINRKEKFGITSHRDLRILIDAVDFIKSHHFIIRKVSEHHELGVFKPLDIFSKHFCFVLAMAAIGAENHKDRIGVFFQILPRKCAAVGRCIKRKRRNGGILKIGRLFF